MNNEVAVRDTSTQLEGYRSTAMQRLGEWAESARAAHEVATQLVQTSFVPEAFRGKAHEATAAILAGSEVGLSPMASLRSFDIIQGTAAPRAITLRAVVQSYGHEIVLDESTATRCVVRARRRGASDWQRVVWTTDRAKGLGLLGKHNWKAQPQAMLVARATSEAARLVAADAILGIGYSSEEIADGDAAPGAAVAPSTEPSGTRKMSRPQRGEAIPPQADDGAEASHVASDAADEEPQGSGGETAPSSETPMVSSGQLSKISAMLREQGVTSGASREDDRTAALAYVGSVIGREIGSRNELTWDEAGRVIDALEADAAALGSVSGTPDPAGDPAPAETQEDGQ